MSFYVYGLMSDEGYHYIGQTSDLADRLARHHQKTTHYTKKGTNWRIVYNKEFPTRSEAMRHEKWLKSGVGREWLKINVAEWSPPMAE